VIEAPRTSEFGYRFDASGIYRAVATPNGIAVSGTMDRVNGIAVDGFAYISLLDGRLLPQPVFPVYGNQPEVIAYDATTGFVYVKNGANAMRRFNAATSDSDANWGLNVAGELGYALDIGYAIGFTPPTADGKGGLWIGQSDDPYLGTPNYFLTRIALELRSTAVFTFGTKLMNSKFFSIAGDYLYPYASKQRLRTSDASIDESWSSAGSALFADKNYVYLSDFKQPYVLSRAKTSGVGTADNWGFTLPAGYELFHLRQALPWPTDVSPDGVAFAGRNELIVKDDPAGNVAQTVIEYYAPAAKRYFITGRKAEQDALDAMPASFTRTGMRFAAKSSRYRDIPEQPVCRLYAAPDKGGSNSHFYGIGNDCPTLNKLSGLKYEGFDFSVLKPASSGCPSEAPNAVTRLFNNKVATNEGNHRYVVSAATKARMLAQGWVDEGAVFCAVTVTEAAN
jgi:hypothetical protein